MRTLRGRLRRPDGQVLLAVLVFSFIFAAVFAALFEAERLHLAKARTRRGADLTAVSAGAVYANGLSLVRRSNVLLLAAAASDVAVIALAAAAGGPAAGLRADPHLRGKIQAAQSVLFGVPLPQDGKRPSLEAGVYPLLISREGFALARANGLEAPGGIPPFPLFLYNVETSRGPQALVPHLALRFRTAAEVLLPEEDGDATGEELYGYFSREDEVFYVFTESQVEHGRRTDGTPYVLPKARGRHHRFLRRVSAVDLERYRGRLVFASGGVSLPDPGKEGGEALRRSVRSLLSGARAVLGRVLLDVTHRDDPPRHTLMLYLPARTAQGDFHTAASVRLVGEGLAAWDLPKPPFRVRLAPLDLSRLSALRTQGLLPRLEGIPESFRRREPPFSSSRERP